MGTGSAGTSRLDAILEHNRVFVRGRAARPLPPAETLPLAIVGCYDPRLDSLLREALGLEPGGAFVLRTAGALVQSGSASLRSLALAVFLFGVREIVIVGHTSCRMASFETASFVDAFRGRGVPREAFGSRDLREWAGAIPSPRRGVQLSVANILAVPFLPRDVIVSAVVLDDTSGALEVVVRPGEAPREAPEAPEAGPPPVEPEPAGKDKEAHAATAPPGPETPTGDHPVDRAAGALLASLASQGRWKNEFRRLRRDVSRRANPMAKLALIESFVQRAAKDSREVGAALERLRREAKQSGRAFGPRELVRLLEGWLESTR